MKNLNVENDKQSKKRTKCGIVSFIMCVDKNYSIDKSNLYSNVPIEVQNHLSRIIGGSYIVIKKETYDNIVKVPKKNKNYVVISESSNINISDVKPGVTFISENDAKTWLLKNRINRGNKNIFIIGDPLLFGSFSQFCDEVILTKFFTSFNGNIIFPNLEMSPNWTLTRAEDILSSDGVDYQYRKFKNLKPVKIINSK